MNDWRNNTYPVQTCNHSSEGEDWGILFRVLGIVLLLPGGLLLLAVSLF